MAFVGGLLRAARSGLIDWRRKYASSVGYVLCIYGGLAGGALLVLLLVAIFIGRPAEAMRLKGIEVFLAALLCLPVGLVLCLRSGRRGAGPSQNEQSR